MKTVTINGKAYKVPPEAHGSILFKMFPKTWLKAYYGIKDTK